MSSHHRSSRPSSRRYEPDSGTDTDRSHNTRSSKSKTKLKPTASRPAAPRRHDSDITGSDGSSYADTEKKASEHSGSTNGSDDDIQSRRSRRAETMPMVKYQHAQDSMPTARRPREYASDTDARASTHHSSRRHHRRSHSTSSDSDSGSDSENEKQKEEKRAKRKAAIQAALTAAAVEAWRSRSDPGGMVNPKKLMRIAGAAIAAGGLDAIMMQGTNHDQFAKMAEAMVGGLALSSTLGGKITHRREGGAKGKAGDSLITMGTGKLMEIMDRKGIPGADLLPGVKGKSSRGTARSKSVGHNSHSHRSRR